MRRLACVLLTATLLAGCAATSRGSAPRAETAQAPPRCSPADPDRRAWFCVVGRILYAAASFFTPVNELTMR